MLFDEDSLSMTTAVISIGSAACCAVAAVASCVRVPWRQPHSFVTCEAFAKVTWKWSGRKKTASAKKTPSQRGVLTVFSLARELITGSDNPAPTACQFSLSTIGRQEPDPACHGAVGELAANR